MYLSPNKAVLLVEGGYAEPGLLDHVGNLRLNSDFVLEQISGSVSLGDFSNICYNRNAFLKVALEKEIIDQT